MPDWVKTVVEALASGPFAEHVFLFGSVSRGSESPGDVDVLVDFRGSPGAPSDDPRMVELLDLYGRFKGSLDLFVLFSDEIASCGGGEWSYGDAVSAHDFHADVEDDLMSLRDWLSLNAGESDHLETEDKAAWTSSEPKGGW